MIQSLTYTMARVIVGRCLNKHRTGSHRDIGVESQQISCENCGSGKTPHEKFRFFSSESAILFCIHKPVLVKQKS